MRFRTDLGLKQQYSEDQNLKNWVKKITALALVRINDVEDAFVLLSEDSIVNNYPQLQSFLDYITLNYFETNNFPLHIWIPNMTNFDNDEPKTNNHLEGFNSKLNKYFNKHPNIWMFIIKIKEEETNATLKYLRIENKTLKTRGRNKKDIENDLQISIMKRLSLL